MKYVLHVDSEPITDRIDLTTLVVPPNKPFRIQDDFIAEKFMEHKAMNHGIVYVEEIHDDDTGQFKLNISKAITVAKEALEKAEIAYVEQYVYTQREDRLRINYPALPPTGRAAEIIRKRKIDLGEEYGIFPVGWGKSEAQTKRDKELNALREANRLAEDRNAKMQEQLAEVLERLQALEPQEAKAKRG